MGDCKSTKSTPNKNIIWLDVSEW